MEKYRLNPFLRQVAAHYLQKTASGTEAPSLDELCFVLPNRRSILFLQNYFKQLYGRPMLAPRMVTINDFLYQLSGECQTDRVNLLMMLYDCYRELRPDAEPLDEFIFWGDALLGDFSDVDKYDCDPRRIFINISDFKNLDWGLDALNQEQQEALQRFVSNFFAGSRKGKHDAREQFRKIWNLLYPLYARFNEVLEEKGCSYEGRVYRRARDLFAVRPAVDILDEVFPGTRRYVFAGLNMLTECERFILKQMSKRSGLAEFCWDYPGAWIAQDDNRASFLRRNEEDFPPAFSLETVTGTPQINVLPVSSAVGQTRQLPAILTQCGILPPPSSANMDADLRLESCALILPDESLMMSALSAIPDPISSVNVTMGYPISQSDLYPFLCQLLSLQLNIRRPGADAGPDSSGPRFYHKPVWAIFSSPVFKLFFSRESGLEQQVRDIKLEAQYYIPVSSLSGSPALDLIFRPVVNDPASADAGQIRQLADYLLSVLMETGQLLSQNSGRPFEAAFAKAACQSVSQLMAKELPVRPSTFARIVENLLAGLSIPFEGEPLSGLQVMGPLESRCLDFENLIVLSCNEGVFPRKSVSASFIPPELRAGFGLPTYENQDAMWAYYFYRMIARSRQVWLLYDNRTEGLKRGEESRFIKQLRYHFNADIIDWTEDLRPVVAAEEDAEKDRVEKTEEMMALIDGMTYSASTLEKYASCPMWFYFAKVEGLSAPAEVSGYLDGSMLGDVFHHTMEALFHSDEKMKADENPDKRDRSQKTPGMPQVTSARLKDWLGREEELRWKIHSLIRHKLKVGQVSGRNIVMAEVILNYVLNTLKAELAYLKEHNADHFNVIDLEHPFSMDYLGVRFCGYIDRIDRLDGGPVRIVDYKTGSDDASCLKMKAETVDKAFTDYKFRAAIQFHLYDAAWQSEHPGASLLNAMYVPYALSDKVVPEDCPQEAGFTAAMKDRLQGIVDDIRDISVPFTRTADMKKCEYCDFKTICGR